MSRPPSFSMQNSEVEGFVRPMEPGLTSDQALPTREATMTRSLPLIALLILGWCVLLVVGRGIYSTPGCSFARCSASASVHCPSSPFCKTAKRPSCGGTTTRRNVPKSDSACHDRSIHQRRDCRSAGRHADHIRVFFLVSGHLVRLCKRLSTDMPPGCASAYHLEAASLQGRNDVEHGRVPARLRPFRLAERSDVHRQHLCRCVSGDEVSSRAPVRSIGAVPSVAPIIARGIRSAHVFERATRRLEPRFSSLLNDRGAALVCPECGLGRVAVTWSSPCPNTGLPFATPAASTAAPGTTVC